MKNTTTDNRLLRLTDWVDAWRLPSTIIRVSLIVMLLWAGSFKLTAPGAEGIVPLIANSPFTHWLHLAFGIYGGSDFIGITEWIAAVLLILGSFRPEAGIIGSLIAIVMFFTTSTMLITTPDALIKVGGMAYMNNTGLFLFKDLVSLGASCYLLSQFREKLRRRANGGVSFHS